MLYEPEVFIVYLSAPLRAQVLDNTMKHSPVKEELKPHLLHMKEAAITQLQLRFC